MSTLHTHQRWFDQDIAKLRETVEQNTHLSLRARFRKAFPNRSYSACYCKAIQTQLIQAARRATKGHWSDLELQFLKRYYSKLGPEGVAKFLDDHTVISVACKAGILGLRYDYPRRRCTLTEKQRQKLLNDVSKLPSSNKHKKC